MGGRLITTAGRGRPMAWDLTGSYVETCSCELMCPCNLSFDHGATYDFCRVTLVFNIQQGQVEGTDIAGRKVAIIADTPKVMTEGNWRLGVYVDDQASDEQLDKLVKVFSGQLGGPMGALAPLVGEVLGVERAAIEVDDDGLRHSVRVGDTIDFDIEDIVPFGVETGELHPGLGRRGAPPADALNPGAPLPCRAGQGQACRSDQYVLAAEGSARWG